MMAKSAKARRAMTTSLTVACDCSAGFGMAGFLADMALRGQHSESSRAVYRSSRWYFSDPLPGRPLGCQSSFVSARLIFGLRCQGSSSGSVLKVILDLEPVRPVTFCANSSIVNSIGLPRFIGPMSSSGEAISRMKPAIRSST